MDWQRHRVLVTGAGGFLGSHLVQRLVAEGARVRALVRYNSRNDWGLLELLPEDVKREVEVVLGDLTDPFSAARALADCSMVFHMAALIAIPYSYLAPSQYVAVNCGGTLNLLQAARSQGVERFIHTSTSETYGTACYLPMDEGHPLRGQSPYAASKIGADKLAESYHLSFGLPVVTVRPFNTYGPRQSARAVIPTIITQALTRNAVHLGHLAPRRDLTFVSDVIEGFLRAAGAPRAVGQVINLGSGQNISVGELAGLILKILGKDGRVVLDEARVRPENSEVEVLLADNRRAAEILDWRPRVPLKEGLRRTADFIAAHLSRYKPWLYTL